MCSSPQRVCFLPLPFICSLTYLPLLFLWFSPQLVPPMYPCTLEFLSNLSWSIHVSDISTYSPFFTPTPSPWPSSLHHIDPCRAHPPHETSGKSLQSLALGYCYSLCFLNKYGDTSLYRIRNVNQPPDPPFVVGLGKFKEGAPNPLREGVN